MYYTHCYNYYYSGQLYASWTPPSDDSSELSRRFFFLGDEFSCSSALSLLLLLELESSFSLSLEELDSPSEELPLSSSSELELSESLLLLLESEFDDSELPFELSEELDDEELLLRFLLRLTRFSLSRRTSVPASGERASLAAVDSAAFALFSAKCLLSCFVRELRCTYFRFSLHS